MRISMSKFTWREKTCMMSLLISAMAAVSPAQTFRTLANFNGANGDDPQPNGLAQGTDGNYYGTTPLGGAIGYGTVYRITPAGALTVVYNFDPGGPDGYDPKSTLLLASDGNFYGTTLGYPGTVFRITPAGVLTTLYRFCAQINCADGSIPYTGLLLGAGGNFYGTTSGGGAGYGTIFELTPAGHLTVLYSLLYGGPLLNLALVQGLKGDLYGTTFGGGALNWGTAYKLTLSGAFTALYSFTGGTDGGNPFASLALGAGQDFYGTTSAGGASSLGTIFKITPSGSLTTLYSFTGAADEGAPFGGLVQANDGNLYGTTSGYLSGFGTIFRITPSGVLTTLHTFTGGNSAYPFATLLQGTDGNFYGTTSAQGRTGPTGSGSVFRLSMGLPPLVKAVPHSGKVGSPVIILGNHLTGTTRVSFNGVPAVFTVISSTEITATVPAGATTGQLAVTTPSGVVSGIFLVRL